MLIAEADARARPTETTPVWACLALGAPVAFYLAKLGLSPIYLVLPVVLLACLPWVWSRLGSAELPSDVLTSLIALAWFATYGLGEFLAERHGTYPNLILGLAVYAWMRILLLEADRATIVRIVLVTVAIQAVIFSLDSLWRVTHPSLPEQVDYNALLDQDLDYYQYKFASLMFADSNTTALAALINLGLLGMIHADAPRRSELLILVFGVVLVSCLSRAAYLGLAVMAYLWMLRRSRSLALIGTLLGLLATYVVMDYISDYQGASRTGFFATKSYIVEAVLNDQHYGFKEILFGFGVGTSERILGFHTHSLPLTLIFETGLVGIAVYGAWLLSSLRSEVGLRANAGYLVATISYTMYLGTPFLFCGAALIAVLADSRQ